MDQMLPRHSVLINADRKRIQSKLFLALTSLPSCKSVAVVSSDVNQQIISIHNITLKYETTRPFAQISERKLMLGAAAVNGRRASIARGRGNGRRTGGRAFPPQPNGDPESRSAFGKLVSRPTD